MVSQPPEPTGAARHAVGLLAFLALLDSIFNYFWPGNGIRGSEGALLVVISTLLLMLADWAVVKRCGRGKLRAVLEVLIFLDFLGTAVAAYFLEAWILLALIVIGFVVWLARLFHPAFRNTSTIG